MAQEIIILNKQQVTQNEELKITIQPSTYRTLYIYDSKNRYVTFIEMPCSSTRCDNQTYKVYNIPPTFNGKYTIKVYDYSTNNWINKDFFVSESTMLSTQTTSNLIAHYKFEDNTQDSSGNNRHGTNSGGTFVAGKINKSISFAESQYVSVADADVFSPSVNNLSIAFWAKVPTTANAKGNGNCGGTGRNFIAKGNSNNWEWAVENDLNSKLCFITWVKSGASGHLTCNVNRVLNDGIWHHYAFIIGANNIVKGYVDGVQLCSSTNVIAAGMGNGNAPVLIGKRGDGNNIIGDLDDMQIYNKTLTAEEVQSLYNRAME